MLITKAEEIQELNGTLVCAVESSNCDGHQDLTQKLSEANSSNNQGGNMNRQSSLPCAAQHFLTEPDISDISWMACR